MVFCFLPFEVWAFTVFLINTQVSYMPYQHKCYSVQLALPFVAEPTGAVTANTCQ